MEATSSWVRLTALGAIAPVVWGTTYVVTTELLPPGRPMTASVLRAVPAGLLLIAWTRSWPQQWGKLALLALLNIGAFFPLLFVAAYRLPGGLAAVVGAAQPFVVAVAAWFMHGRQTPLRQLAWTLVAVVGVGMTLGGGVTGIDPVGAVAACAGTVSMALGITLTRAWGPTAGLSGLASTGWQLLLGGIMITPLVPLLDQQSWVLTAKGVAGYLWLSVVGGALAYAVWFRAARSLPPTSTSLLGPLSPITAAALGWLILGQELTVAQSAGFALALAASILGQIRGPRVSAVRPGGRRPWRPGPARSLSAGHRTRWY